MSTPFLPDLEVGDIAVVRLAIDGSRRARVETELATSAAFAAVDIGAYLRGVAGTLLAERGGWRHAGALEVDSMVGGELRPRFVALGIEERARVANLGTPDGDPSAPFRERYVLGDRGVLLFVLVLAVREWPALRAHGELEPVAVDARRDGETVAQALEVLARIESRDLVSLDVIVTSCTIADLTLAYGGGELFELAPRAVS